MDLYSIFETYTVPEPNTGCLLWNHGAHEYGSISIDGKAHYAHRMSYELHKGPIPHGMVVCHKCDTPGCVNPEHLFISTIAGNNRDKTAKGRHPFGVRNHCGKGHEYTEDSLKVISGKRRCLICQKDSAKNRSKRKVLL